MGTAVSFEYFPVDFSELGLFGPNEKAGPPNQPRVTPREGKQGQFPVVVQGQLKSPRVSTEPQYTKAAQRQATVTVGIDRAKASPNTLPRVDGKAEVIRQDGSPNMRADHTQDLLIPSNKAVSASREARSSLQDSKQPEFPAVQRPKTISQLDNEIVSAIEAKNTESLRATLDAHPHAGPDPKDKSIGAFFLKCFREIASWFNSAAFAWQGKQAVGLLKEAARVGNAEAVQILLDRGMDLGKDKPMVEPALRIAVTSGNAEVTRLLLREVIREDPSYVKNVDLTGTAARAGHADVLEVLVEGGMALPPKNSWPHYGHVIESYLRWFEAGKTTMWSGFAAETVKRLVEKLDSNAGRYIPRRADSASANLKQAIADGFERFTTSGWIRPDLLKHLMDQGMYGLVAGMVVNAARLAVASPSWNTPGANRKAVFANALDQSAEHSKDTVHQAGDASGDPDLFDKLLSPQLELLIAYQQSCHAQDPVRSTRKRRATI
jgi:hypothetical protein